jgi:hypothetical protein
MQEFWVCDGCKSLVRRLDPTCYRCGRPRAVGDRSVDAGARGAVLTPGVDGRTLQGVAWTLSTGGRYVSVRYLSALAALLVMADVVLSTAHAAVTVALESRLMDSTIGQIVNDQVLPRDLVDISTQLFAIELIVWVLGTIAWIALVGISVHNAPALGAGTPPSTTLEAVGWWFVPLFNLVRPVQIVNDVYERLAVQGSARSMVVGVWWAGFLLAWLIRVPISWLVVFVMTAALFMGWTPSVREVTGVGLSLDILADLFYLASGLALVQVILELGRRQRVREAWVAAGAAA